MYEDQVIFYFAKRLISSLFSIQKFENIYISKRRIYYFTTNDQGSVRSIHKEITCEMFVYNNIYYWTGIYCWVYIQCVKDNKQWQSIVKIVIWKDRDWHITTHFVHLVHFACFVHSTPARINHTTLTKAERLLWSCRNCRHATRQRRSLFRLKVTMSTWHHYHVPNVGGARVVRFMSDVI